MTRLVFHSWQRAGAVTNATLSEFASAKKVVGTCTCWVMQVLKHKTAREGQGNTTFTKKDHWLTSQYVCYMYIWPLCKPTTNHLFVGSKGHPIKHVKLIRWLAGHPPKPPHTHWPEADRCHRSCTSV